MGFYIGGATCFVIALILFFVYRYNLAKYQSIKLAIPAKAGDLVRIFEGVAEVTGSGQWKDYVKINGTVQCEHPLTSPLKQEPCVYYSSSIVREYEETETRTDSEGEPVTEVNRRTETISSEVRSVPFQIRDETGEITVDPNGAAFEPLEILSRFEPEGSGSRRRAYGYERPSYGSAQSGGGGGYGGYRSERRDRGYEESEYGDYGSSGDRGYGSAQSGGGGDYGGYRSERGDRGYGYEEASYGDRGERTLGYRYTESVIPVGRRIFVMGAASDSSGIVLVSKPTQSKYKFIISTKSEEQVAKDARKSANMAFYGMLASFAIGILFVFAGLISTTPVRR